MRGIVGFSAGVIFSILSKDIMGKNNYRKIKSGMSSVLLLWYFYTIYKQLLGNARLIILLDAMIIPALIYIIENIQPLKDLLNKKSKRFPFGKFSGYIYFLHYPGAYLFVNICKGLGMQTDSWSMCIIYIIGLNFISGILINIKNKMSYRRSLF